MRKLEEWDAEMGCFKWSLLSMLGSCMIIIILSVKFLDGQDAAFAIVLCCILSVACHLVPHIEG